MKLLGSPFSTRPIVFGTLKFLLLVLLAVHKVDSSVIVLNKDNFDAILASNQVVLVNFYADWCRFSQNLKPVFEDASNRFSIYEPGKVAFASLDCDRNPEIAQKYHVSKYPTLKLFRHGELVKKEYRGQRSADAFFNYINQELEIKLINVSSVEDLQAKIDKSKRYGIAYFKRAGGVEFETYQRVASALREDCTFLYGVGEWTEPHTNKHSIFFKNSQTNNDDFMAYTGPLDNFDIMKNWFSAKCVPLVREITFENAEELTEEGIPFLILFRVGGDETSLKMFTETVENELADQRTAINCLVADGKRFAHPLHHLGKSEKDLPVIAIDSFRHMYLFGDFSKIGIKGQLRQFVLDLHSGKLHREFHHGPDPTKPNNNAPSDTQPPPSVFKKLKPSDNRYSLLTRDEL